jgi:hypothetical protein
VTFSGTVPAESTFPELKPGWNLVSLPVPGTTPLPTPGDGDQIYVRGPAPDQYRFQLSQGTNGVWEPQPAIGVGEGFWYFRNADPTNLQPVRSSIYVNNYVPFFGINAQISQWDGCKAPGPMDGTNYLGQLHAGPGIILLQRIGQPLPFLSGSAASGYFNTSSGAVWNIPTVQAGAIAYLQMRFWDSLGGTITSYADAAAVGVSLYGEAPFFASLPLGGFGAPPSLPTPLTGLQSLLITNSLSFEFQSQPANVRSRPGGQANFRVVMMSHESGFVFQWQKSVNQLNWIDLGNANLTMSSTSVYSVQSVTPADVGFYRVVVSRGQSCFGKASNPVTLTLLGPPQLTGIGIGLTNGTASAYFTLNGDPFLDYRI